MARKRKRPEPPLTMAEPRIVFVADRKLDEWVRTVFLSSESQFYNPDHDHLNSALIGYLWTNVAVSKGGRRVLGEARSGHRQNNLFRWSKAAYEFQVIKWFGDTPDFIITLDGVAVAGLSDVQFHALIDHELYHCGHAVDEFGVPKFNKQTGLPTFCIRGHDTEEFSGVVRRWGPSEDVKALISAAKKPEFTEADIVCGVEA